MILAKTNKIIDKLYYWIIAVVILFSVAIRLVGVDWGLPRSDMHPDEGIIFHEAYECVVNHTFESHQYYRPNHVSIKLNTLLYTAIQELYFSPRGLDDFSANFSANISIFITASRLLTAFMGVGIVFFVFLIGLNFGRKQALLATVLAAAFPSFIEHSHYITPDIPLLFFLVAVLWASLNYLKSPSVHWLFWMALFTSLAVCEKYPGAYGCVIIAVTVCVSHYKKPARILRDGLIAIAFFIIGILAVSPVLVIDFKTVLSVMAGQNKEYHIGADGLNFGQTLIFYIKTAMVHCGLVISLTSIYGLVRLFSKNTRQAIVLLTFGAYLIPISTLKIHWERYTLPLYTAFILLGSIGIISLFEDFEKLISKNNVITIVSLIVLVALPIGSVISEGLAVSGSFLAPDSRILLQETFDSIGVTKDNTMYDCNTPLDPSGFFGAFSDFEEADPARCKWGNPIFVMTSSAIRDVALESKNEVYGWIADFYRKLDSDYPLVFLYTVENPSSHFIEVQNMWYAARSVYRYMRGAAKGYEIRLYQLRP